MAKTTGLSMPPPQAPRPKHLVPANVSGEDVSQAVARMPKLPNALLRNAAGNPATAGSVEAPAPESMPMRQEGAVDGNAIFKVPVDLLDDSPYQPRIKYDETSLSELGESLLHCQEEAIVVKAKPDGRYELVSGHRRTRGARMWDITHLDARLFTRADEELALSALITNDAREDLSDYERGRAYVAVVEAGKRGVGPIKQYDQLAQRLGKSKGLIAQRVKLTKLPPYVLAVLDEHPRAVSINSVAELSKVLDKPHDEAKLVQNLLRVAAGEISMTALTSIMASQSGTGQGSGMKTQQTISLQTGTKVYAQLVQNTDKRKLTISLPNKDVDVDEASRVIAEALEARFGQKGKAS